MKRFAPLCFALSLLIVPSIFPRDKKSKDPHSAKFGDLVVTATIMTIEPVARTTDRNNVAIFVHTRNTGKGVVCASLHATLKTSFNLEYTVIYATPSYPSPPRMHEMLPGEIAEGSYAFNVKDGVRPLVLVLSLLGKTIRCGPEGEVSWHDIFVLDEIRLDVHDLAASEEQPSVEPEEPPKPANTLATSPGAAPTPATSEATTQTTTEKRVFLTDRKSWEAFGLARNARTGTESEQSALVSPRYEFMKVFHEHCPSVALITSFEKIHYVVTLDHSSWHSPPYRVAVFGYDGDVVYSGGTQFLRNAVNDACHAIAASN